MKYGDLLPGDFVYDDKSNVGFLVSKLKNEKRWDGEGLETWGCARFVTVLRVLVINPLLSSSLDDEELPTDLDVPPTWTVMRIGEVIQQGK